MKVEKINIDGKIYDYVISCDDEKETNDIDLEETEDLTEVIQYIQESK